MSTQPRDDFVATLGRRIRTRDADPVLPRDHARALAGLLAEVESPALGTGRGRVVLLSGPAGTGKTMTAAFIARRLAVDLVLVVLPRLVRYAAEDPGLLDRMFHDAAAERAILVFDDLRPVLDREMTSWIERYPGLAIVTSIEEAHLDAGFLSRLALHLRFERPDVRHRERIWALLLGRLPLAADVDFATLARHDLAGGDIMQIVYTASLAAADHGGPIGMVDLERRVQREMQWQLRCASRLCPLLS